MTDRPRIGDFRSAPNNSPRQEAAPPATTASETPAAKTPETTDSATTDRELTPRERYAKRLEEAKISLHAAQAIFDAVMDKGYYEETVQVGKQRAVFRTRLYEDHLRLQSALEAFRPSLVISQEDMITRYNLAASLYEWRGAKLPHETDDDFDKVVALLKKTPGPVFSVLAEALAKFDQKTMLVFGDGATDSF